jgi:isocitrate lyase
LKAIYLSGWQVAADANLGGQMYPDQSLYPANSVPNVVRSINNALMRADQIAHAEGQDTIDWMLPIVADAEAGFGGVLNAFELMKGMIEAGAAAVHFEDQLSSAKKCGHMGGKVMVPTRDAIQKLVAARLAADVMDVPTILVARTDANGAQLITSDCDPIDAPFLTSERTVEGFIGFRGGIDAAIARGLAYAPYADMIWCETSEPNIGEARKFATAIHAQFPGKLLAYNCSPSFNWKAKLNERQIAEFQRELGAMGYPSSSWRTDTRSRECRPIRSCSSANSSWLRSMDTARSSISALLARVTSTIWPTPLPPARLRSARCPAQPKKSSSRKPPASWRHPRAATEKGCLPIRLPS